MSEYVCNKALEERLVDLRRGLHAAMDAYIKDMNLRKGEIILRQMDDHMRLTFTKMNVDQTL